MHKMHKRSFTIGDVKVSVGERKDRPGRVQVTVRDSAGGRVRRSFGSSAEAEEWIEELRQTAAAEGVVMSRDLREAVESFLRERKTMDLAEKTLRHNREMLNPALSFFGSATPLRDVATDARVRDYSAASKSEVKPATRRHRLRILRQLFVWAHHHQWIDRVPVVELPRDPDPRQEWLRSNEIHPFLEACAPTFRPLAEAAIYFGLREAEVCNAQAGDFDLHQGILWVRAKPELGWAPKGGRNRAIPLAGRGLEIAQEIAQRPLGAWAWPNRQGERRRPCPWWSQATKRAAAGAGITRDLVYHDLRRTCGATLVEAGVHLAVVQRILGHASIRTTERVYAPICDRVIAEGMAQSAALLERRDAEHAQAQPKLRVVGL